MIQNVKNSESEPHLVLYKPRQTDFMCLASCSTYNTIKFENNL